MSLVQNDVCTFCGTTPRPGARFCDQCGKPFSPDPNRTVWNIFTRWKGQEKGPWNAVFAEPFESYVDALASIGDHRSNARMDIYLGAYIVIFNDQTQIYVSVWRQIREDGYLGPDEGNQAISLTTLELTTNR